MDVLRQAGDEEFIARGLLACAVLRPIRSDHDGGSADLDEEALEIAERGHYRRREREVAALASALGAASAGADAPVVTPE